MKLVLVGLLLFFTSSASANDCNEECLSAANCSTTSCPVCIGICVDCHALASQTECAETSTGASTNCTWSTDGDRCMVIGEVPEMPRSSRNLWLVLFSGVLVLLAGYVVRKKTARPGQPR